MTKDEFARLFEESLSQAVLEIEVKINRTIPRHFLIAFHGFGYANKETLSFSHVLDLLYISEELFYRIIDIAVIEVRENATVFFLRVSGHQPCSWAETYYGDTGRGPFKRLFAQSIIWND